MDLTKKIARFKTLSVLENERDKTKLSKDDNADPMSIASVQSEWDFNVVPQTTVVGTESEENYVSKVSRFALQSNQTSIPPSKFLSVVENESIQMQLAKDINADPVNIATVRSDWDFNILPQPTILGNNVRGSEVCSSRKGLLTPDIGDSRKCTEKYCTSNIPSIALKSNGTKILSSKITNNPAGKINLCCCEISASSSSLSPSKVYQKPSNFEMTNDLNVQNFRFKTELAQDGSTVPTPSCSPNQNTKSEFISNDALSTRVEKCKDVVKKYVSPNTVTNKGKVTTQPGRLKDELRKTSNQRKLDSLNCAETQSTASLGNQAKEHSERPFLYSFVPRVERTDEIEGTAPDETNTITQEAQAIDHLESKILLDEMDSLSINTNKIEAPQEKISNLIEKTRFQHSVKFEGYDDRYKICLPVASNEPNEAERSVGISSKGTQVDELNHLPTTSFSPTFPDDYVSPLESNELIEAEPKVGFYGSEIHLDELNYLPTNSVSPSFPGEYGLFVESNEDNIKRFLYCLSLLERSLGISSTNMQSNELNNRYTTSVSPNISDDFGLHVESYGVIDAETSVSISRIETQLGELNQLPTNGVSPTFSDEDISFVKSNDVAKAEKSVGTQTQFGELIHLPMICVSSTIPEYHGSFVESNDVAEAEKSVGPCSKETQHYESNRHPTTNVSETFQHENCPPLESNEIIEGDTSVGISSTQMQLDELNHLPNASGSPTFLNEYGSPVKSNEVVEAETCVNISSTETQVDMFNRIPMTSISQIFPLEAEECSNLISKTKYFDTLETNVNHDGGKEQIDGDEEFPQNLTMSFSCRFIAKGSLSIKKSAGRPTFILPEPEGETSGFHNDIRNSPSLCEGKPDEIKPASTFLKKKKRICKKRYSPRGVIHNPRARTCRALVRQPASSTFSACNFPFLFNQCNKPFMQVTPVTLVPRDSSRGKHIRAIYNSLQQRPQHTSNGDEQNTPNRNEHSDNAASTDLRYHPLRVTFS